jgi:hypothetical protein
MVTVEVRECGFEDGSKFDFVWDEIREHYDENLYSLKNIEKKKNFFLIKFNIKKRSAYKGKRKLKRD